LFEKLGMPLIEEASALLLSKVQADSELCGFFKDHEGHSVPKMAKYLAYSFGEPSSWEGK
jgi:hypothetical protein